MCYVSQNCGGEAKYVLPTIEIYVIKHETINHNLALLSVL